jgi:hypothetical protein
MVPVLPGLAGPLALLLLAVLVAAPAVHIFMVAADCDAPIAVTQQTL